MVYVDEFGNQKAVSPDELLIKSGNTQKPLGTYLNDLETENQNLKKELLNLKDEFLSFKSKQIQNTSDILENQSVHNKKIEALSNDVKALLSINKKN